MNDIYTSEIRDASDASEVSASGQWSEDFRIPFTRFCNIGQMASVALMITVSSATAIPDDPWVRKSKTYDQSTWIYQPAIGRPITQAEALRIACQILEQAERERLEIAEFEATRGIQWEDKA